MLSVLQGHHRSCRVPPHVHAVRCWTPLREACSLGRSWPLFLLKAQGCIYRGRVGGGAGDRQEALVTSSRNSTLLGLGGHPWSPIFLCSCGTLV